MQRILKLLSSIILLSSAGCISKPPPSTLELWEKPGVDKSVVQQALSKCGWKPIYASSESMDSRVSEFAAVYECMTQAGYRYKLQDSKGIYFSLAPRSDSFLVNLMVAGYQQVMDNDTFGVTNSTKQERDLMLRLENDRKRQKIKKALKK
ncbi:hypothetical protein [Bartonella tribocorum]|uniref:Lipoprotein n=1 Tax=Bartonella tribocorum (strain DSM 28219 / CCUG 45778 / CIP 105476 / IBS 506) TaxID=382640 RepID=A9IVV2_BART1|nr:hypothetical protein [Bartonella tribocorum]CAK01807.1 hypothetical protein BT_1453 [Bartonella tribocorum CIP 105476]CDO49054.1 filamentous hemagglutinin [Bartonella tribocorum]